MDGTSFLLSDKVHALTGPFVANGVQSGCGVSLKQFYDGREGILFRPAIPDVNQQGLQTCSGAFVTKEKIAVPEWLPYIIIP
ncbi:hypothetical protein ACQ5TV_07435 [Acetobacter ghanensis]|uniref:hypothetical protein n=1 Tax=Acetobacter ghanensis TaxID=431306 RepID=UPI003D33B658